MYVGFGAGESVQSRLRWRDVSDSSRNSAKKAARQRRQRGRAGSRLRRRINEMLAPSRPEGVPSAPSGDATEENSDLEDFHPYDSTHLFWEEIKQLGFAFRNIRREDLTDELIEEILRAAQPLWTVRSSR